MVMTSVGLRRDKHMMGSLMRRRTLVCAACMMVALPLGGCSSAGEADVAAAAGRFQQAVATGNWSGACGLLSDQARTPLEGTAARSCPSALAVLRLPSDRMGDVQIWGRNAMVTSGSNAVFLSLFSSGWQVIAAGCTSQGEDLPYQCSVRS